jgi:hypothetical protein
MAKKKVQVYLSEELHNIVKKLAAEQDRSTTDLIKEGIIAVLCRYGKK